MSLVASFLPSPRIHEVDHAAVGAPPDVAWPAVRALDLYDTSFIRWLFELRLAPERLVKWLSGQPDPMPKHARIEDIVAPLSGFSLLEEQPGRELVIGSIGKFWQPEIEWRYVPRDQFATFAQPGWGKLAWNLQVDPRAAGGSWLTCDLRVSATDDASWKKFQPYWLLIGRFSRAIRHAVLHRLEEQLGPAPEGPVPGDDVLRKAPFVRTHRRVIEGRPAAVWPWLVQLGARRAGWYALDLLDNGGVHSAERIVPELQQLAVGDRIPATPRGDGSFAVLALEPERALVLGSPSLVNPAANEPPYKMTWAFALEPVGDAATELTVRVRASYEPTAAMTVTSFLVGLEHELMERLQLHNLARRVERGAA